MMMRMRLAALLVLLVACGDDAPVAVDAAPAADARPDTPYAPAINWDAYGGECQRSSYGAVACYTPGGLWGVCALDGPIGQVPEEPYTAHCQAPCNPRFYMHECPPDAEIVSDGYNSQGCWCVKK